jgi:hypothetical protein
VATGLLEPAIQTQTLADLGQRRRRSSRWLLITDEDRIVEAHGRA